MPDLSDADRLVVDYYARAFEPTDLAYKAFDWRMLAFGPMLIGRDILNVGVGWPHDEMILGHYARTWTALDVAHAQLVKCAAGFRFPHRVAWVTGDVRDLPFRAGSFDTVFDFSSGDHVAERRDAMHAECFRVLRAGGYHLVTYANRERVEGVAEDVVGGDFGYTKWATPGEILAALGAVGFEVVAHEPGPRSGVVVRRPEA